MVEYGPLQSCFRHRNASSRPWCGAPSSLVKYHPLPVRTSPCLLHLTSLLRACAGRTLSSPSHPDCDTHSLYARQDILNTLSYYFPLLPRPSRDIASTTAVQREPYICDISRLPLLLFPPGGTVPPGPLLLLIASSLRILPVLRISFFCQVSAFVC
jgi:hypothetical protein